jgi:hypothetical protein
VQAVDEVMTGKVRNAFSAMRPPATMPSATRAMGFCFFNNAAIAARHAQKAHGAERVAIVDWDVHHGNGSQDIFWSDGSVMYCSTHQMPLYPGTGAVSERGDRDTIVNAPLRPGDGGDIFREAFEIAILPRLESFGPTSSSSRPVSTRIGAIRSRTSTSPRRISPGRTQKLMALADRRCDGRIVSLLEGGYDLDGLSKSVRGARLGADGELRQRLDPGAGDLLAGADREGAQALADRDGSGRPPRARAKRARRSGRQATQPRARARSRRAPRGGSGSAPSAGD